MRQDAARLDFESIVRDHQEKVRKTCYRLVNNREDADDLAQEVFVQVHGALGRFRRDADLSTWIYRIAVNKSLDLLRREKRKKRFARIRSLFGQGGDIEKVPDSAGGDPLRRLEDLERRDVLMQAVDRLPDSQKAALTLSRYEEFSNQEIAAIMGLSLPAVEALLHRAKKTLRGELSDYFEKRLR